MPHPHDRPAERLAEPTAEPPAETRGSSVSRLSRALRRDLPHPRAAVASAAAVAAMLLGIGFLPVPYVIEQPGPAIDVLGTYEGTEVLSIEGMRTYPTEGQLMMTTVAIDGGPGYPVTPAEVVLSWFDPTRAVMPREMYFPEGQTRQQTDLENTVQMTSSQQEAAAVALRDLGHDVPAAVVVGGVLTDSPADGILQPGDVIREVNGRTAGDVAGYQALAAQTPAGQDVQVTISRQGEEETLQVPTETAEDGSHRMGIVLAPGYDMPVDITIGVGGVGGPSAGTMFALSLYDELTPGPLAGGEHIAGTGTIAIDGAVGPIGGIRQKMVGAEEAGADFFLAPAGNCDEVPGYVPDGLEVVKVSTFEDAREAVTTIGETGSAAGLPTCEE